MNMKRKMKQGKQTKDTKNEAVAMAYRLKCAKTANGLSHFVMYGDVQKNTALL
jgi:hypothetical protein